MAAKRKLRFGLWYDFRNPMPWRRTYKEVYDATIDQITWAESIGYDDVWLTEHHFVDDGHAPSLLIQAAAIAMRTKKMRIGTAVLLLPQYNPVRVAEDCATIDILSGGRFELGVGIGYKVDEFTGLGFKRSERGGRMDEALEIISRLWAGETVTFHGKYFDIEGAHVTPEPMQKPRPPIWVGGFARVSARRAARYDGYIGALNQEGLYKMYQEELRAAGKDPAAAARIGGGHFWLVVSNDPEKTWNEIAPHVLYQLNVYAKWITEAGLGPVPILPDLAALKARGDLIVATPQDAIKHIEDFTAKVPLDRYYTWTIPPGYPVRKMDPYLELFATKVMPHFR